LPPPFSTSFTIFRQDPRVYLSVLVIVLALVGIAREPSPLPVSANGGATLIASQEAGPYRIDVSILPAPAVVANTHLSILLRSLSNDQIITDAAVYVSATGPEGAAGLGPIRAPNDAAPQFFEVNLPFDMEGPWRVTIAVSSALGEETITVPLEVREGGGGINWILLAAVAVAIVTVGVWTWDRVAGRRSQAAEEN